MSEPSAKKRGLPGRVKMRHQPHFVEELAARHDAPVGQMIPIAAIEPDPSQPRSVMGELGDLVASIGERGVLEPILIRPNPDAAGDSSDAAPTGQAELLPGSGQPDRTAAHYRIISGERRYRAAREAGLYEIPAIVMEVTEVEALEVALIENLQRKDLTPFEEADGYQALADLHGYTQEEIAGAVGKSRTVVTESLALLGMPRRVREAAQALGLSSKSLLLEVLKAGSEEDMIRLLEEVSRRGLSRDDLRRRLRAGGKDSKSPARKKGKPYTFKFKAPDKTYSLSLSFRQSEVDRGDLIRALEETLRQLREEAEQGG